MITLRGNLAEMAFVKNDLLAELVPSPNQEEVFHRDFLLFNASNHTEAGLAITLQKIQTLFGACFLQLKTHNATYFKYFIKNPHKNERSREKILEIVTWIYPTIKHFIKDPELPYIQFLSGFSKLETIQSECSLTYAVKKIKDFETISRSSVPIPLLYALALNQKLTDKGEIQVKEWIATLKTNVRSFHHFLKILTSRFPNQADLATLELALENRQCSLFQMPDKRIKMPKTGDLILIKGENYPLGSLLSVPKAFPVYFALQNDPSLMLAIEPNEAIKGMKKHLIDAHHSGIMMPLTIDEEGAFSIIERCYHPLNKIHWKEAFVDQAKPLVQLLQGLFSLTFTPAPLLPENFSFNFQGEMRCLALMQPQVKSFEEIELFAWKCAKNSTVFSHLAKASKMAEQDEARAYQELMRFALKGKDIAISLGGLIKNERILNYRKQFYLSVKDLKAKLIKETGKKKISQSIARCHLKYCPGHFFVPNFYELCKIQITKDNCIV